MSNIKLRVTEAMKEAMRAKDKDRLNAIRLILAACKQIEVDERIELDDVRVLAILDKMLKQRQDSIQQFEAAGRHDLVAVEQAEVAVIKSFMPEPFSEAEVKERIRSVIQAVGAQSAQDMGKVMALIKPQLQGRADMTKASTWVKELLT